MSNSEARRQAEDSGLDLVEIVPNADPPVCRVMNFGKFLFELNKKKACGQEETKAGSSKGNKIQARYR